LLHFFLIFSVHCFSVHSFFFISASNGLHEQLRSSSVNWVAEFYQFKLIQSQLCDVNPDSIACPIRWHRWRVKFYNTNLGAPGCLKDKLIHLQLNQTHQKNSLLKGVMCWFFLHDYIGWLNHLALIYNKVKKRFKITRKHKIDKQKFSKTALKCVKLSYPVHLIGGTNIGI
jgi:hypothetical protein